MTAVDDSLGSCGGDPAPEVVYRWTAPTRWHLRAIHNGSSFDTVLHVRDGPAAAESSAATITSAG